MRLQHRWEAGLIPGACTNNPEFKLISALNPRGVFPAPLPLTAPRRPIDALSCAVCEPSKRSSVGQMSAADSRSSGERGSLFALLLPRTLRDGVADSLRDGLGEGHHAVRGGCHEDGWPS